MPAWHFVMSGLPSLLFAFITINTTPGAALEHLLSNPLKPAVGVVQQSVLYQRDFVWDDQQGSASCRCLHCLHPWEQSFLLESMVNPYSGTSSLASVRGSCVNLTICAGRSRVAPDAWRAIRALLRPFERAMY